MGTNVFTYFLNWVERPVELGGGGGGPDWVANHIHAYLNIGGPLLGVPKAAAALVSGEMRDTAQFGALNAYLIDNFFSKSQRAAMFRYYYNLPPSFFPPPFFLSLFRGLSLFFTLIRSWGSVPSMLPKGGAKIWGDHHGSADESPIAGSLFSVVSSMTEEEKLAEEHQAEMKEKNGSAVVNPHKNYTLNTNCDSHLYGKQVNNITADHVLDFILHATGDTIWHSFVSQVYGMGVADPKELVSSLMEFLLLLLIISHSHLQTEGTKYDDHKYWSNPLESRLPLAPNMKIYCLYGVGKDTERGYYYKEGPVPLGQFLFLSLHPLTLTCPSFQAMKNLRQPIRLNSLSPT